MSGLGILPESEDEYETDEDEIGPDGKKIEIVRPAPIRAEDRKSPKQRMKERKVKKEQTR